MALVAIEKNKENRYRKIEKIGEGTYGVVYRTYDTESEKIVALKKIRVDSDDEGIPPTAIREISILKILKHPNIVDLIDIVYSQNKLFLIFEYLECDLKRYIDHHDMSHEKVKSFLHQLLQGLLYCHLHRVIHRDLKPQNILVKDGTQLKIADFGLCRAVNIPIRTLTHEVVTLWYRAPEILLGAKIYSVPIDMWSIGCIFAEMIEKKPLFMGDSEIDQLFKIFRMLGTPSQESNPSLANLPDFKDSFPKWKGNTLESRVPSLCEQGKDLLKKMLMLNPEDRITMREALKHPYFENANFV